jgi:uncharacterized protein YoaH (UPF0181 family)
VDFAAAVEERKKLYARGKSSGEGER